jgi:thioredoxin-like negative regulator of GroEL
MKYIFTLLLIAGFIFTTNAQAELSLAKHVRMAESLKQEGKFADAAYHYEQAWLKKTKKTDLIFQAAECYYTIRDFRKAMSKTIVPIILWQG